MKLNRWLRKRVAFASLAGLIRFNTCGDEDLNIVLYACIQRALYVFKFKSKRSLAFFLHNLYFGCLVALLFSLYILFRAISQYYMLQIFKLTRRDRPRYEPYGILVTKQYAYRKGAYVTQSFGAAAINRFQNSASNDACNGKNNCR